MESIVGKVIDVYKITGVLGKGGMGVVYKARDLNLERDVAIKMMNTNLADDEHFLKRFQSEAKALAKLPDTNIVTVFALRESEFGICIIMEYVEGETLAQKIRERGPLPVPRALMIFKQLLSALDRAHQAGIIHRDIKPPNIMLTDQDHVKVTDFGLAKVQQPSPMTMTTGTGGTLFYMSPEQIRGLANVDQRGDIYSVGMTLYEALTGSVPFSRDDTDFSVRQAIVEGKIDRPSKLNALIPPDLEAIVLKAINKDPDKRFQSAAEMLNALAKAERRLRVQDKHVVSWPQRIVRSGQLKYIIAGVVLLLVAGIAVRLFDTVPETELQIKSNPASVSVYIDGDSAGHTPIIVRRTAPGSLKLRLQKEGYEPKDTTLVTVSGKELRLFFSLVKTVSSPLDASEPIASDQYEEPQGLASDALREPVRVLDQPAANATLTMSVIPFGSIKVDGQLRAAHASGATTVVTPAGERNITFEHPDYGTKSVIVRLDPGETRTLTCYFESYISVQALPVWGIIVINGQSTEISTPKDRLPIGPGRHRITVTRSGYETAEGEQEVVVAPDLKENVYPLVFHLVKK